ncbi:MULTISPECIES: NUDIX hydrolase [Aestuariibaculum]|uniref:NUDIX hydrolase n=1 Tax=Aestuariibaculum marinum TaxID=2683592 RepID=A0A8J6U486_9FLAO|nr:MULTISPECIES: NUDIX domain-containing protein [Aestuariibaculum]MBD0823797.1 NUDIX hydrolase [Aestuariibaculum marinum]WMI66193.1 NUDIX domain-containing protein [Aestuariibaculum sp. YM273]
MNKKLEQKQQIKLAVDCIIFGFNNNRLELLLVHRGFEPEKGKWSLIGGFVGNDEDIDDAANRVLYDLSGLENIYMEQVRTFGKADRDSSGRVVSTTYSAMILKSEYNEERVGKYDAKWFPIEDLPELIFDHSEMVGSAIRRLRRRVRNFPIAFNLLPAKFTLPQLQMLYEGILSESLDKRNFRRKVSQMNYLVRLEEKDMSESRKGAYFYRFDEELYNKELNFNL